MGVSYERGTPIDRGRTPEHLYPKQDVLSTHGLWFRKQVMLLALERGGYKLKGFEDRTQNNCFSVLGRGSKEVTYSRLVDFCITHLQAESN